MVKYLNKYLLDFTTTQFKPTDLFRILLPVLAKIHFPPQETYCLTQESYPYLLYTQPTKLTRFNI